MTAKRAVIIGMLMDFYAKSFLLIGIGTVMLIDGLNGAATVNTSGIVGSVESLLASLLELIGIVLVAVGMVYFLVLTYYSLRKEEEKQTVLN
jgi:nucleoside recognition membrane protein YjiH